MNVAFAEATTSGAFVLHLTATQCSALLYLAEHGDTKKAIIFDVPTFRQLRDRGLFAWEVDSNGLGTRPGELTKAGQLTAELLKEAGMTAESCMSPRVRRRLEEWFGKAA